MDFWHIGNEETSVRIEWSGDLVADYRKLAYQFFDCGYKTLDEVVGDDWDIHKTDMWTFVGIYLLRHSIELGLKALLCRVLLSKQCMQKSFEECGHDVSMLLRKYFDANDKDFLTLEEKMWLSQYLTSLEEVDKKSDVFRFPFEDAFLSKYRDEFLDINKIVQNLIQAFSLIKKCLEMGSINCEFDKTLKPEFLIFSTSDECRCYIWQSLSDNGFHVKITGYNEVIDFIYKNRRISNDDKLYPLMFMFRNVIELSLKRLFYSKVEHGVPSHKFNSKRKSHCIKKDLWKCVGPVIKGSPNFVSEELSDDQIVENMLNEIDKVDRKGDVFRYPTSYSLEYRLNNRKLDLDNIYMYLRAIINFLDGCDTFLDEKAEFEMEMKYELKF